MVRLSRIYTRTGDGGETHLAGGQTLSKDAPRVEAFGTVDELMAQIGVVRAENDRAPQPSQQLDAQLRRIQNELFNLGAELAMLPADRRKNTPSIESRHVESLEAEIDEMNSELKPLESFVLPGGSALCAAVHVARSVCRRAEREVIRMGHVEPLPEHAIRYLNRLSDWLFVAARFVAHSEGQPEPLWEPEKT